MSLDRRVEELAEKWGMGLWGPDAIHRSLEKWATKGPATSECKNVLLRRESIWASPEMLIRLEGRFSVTSKRSTKGLERRVIAELRRQRADYAKSFGFERYLDEPEALKLDARWLFQHVALGWGWTKIASASKQSVGETTVRQVVIPLFELLYGRRPKLQRGRRTGTAA
jgi:hypothetical protein